jgi:hypothetical protein
MVNSFDDIRPSQKLFVIKWLVILMFLAPKMQNPNPFSIGTLEGLVVTPDHYVSFEQRWEEEYEKVILLWVVFFCTPLVVYSASIGPETNGKFKFSIGQIKNLCSIGI